MAQETSNFYKGLRRLFSNNVIVRYVGKKKIKVVDADGFQLRHGSPQKYSRMRTYAKIEESSAAVQGAIDRKMLYNDYMAMDKDPILSSALDLYSEESTTRDEFEDILTIKTENKNIEDILQNLFYDILNIPFNLGGGIRNMCKFGDNYLYLELHKSLGIINAKILSPYDIERLEGVDEENPYLVQFAISGDTKDMLEEFQIAHFRLIGDVFHFPYGRSMLEGGRMVGKQLKLMEDAMMIHRITRAPEKRIIKIDVGALPPDEIDDHMENIMNGMRRVPFIDQATGEYNLKYNIMNINEDFFFPVRGGDSGTEIDSLSGMEYGIIEDIEYLQRKLFASLRIPKAFLSFEDEIGSKATLAAEDLRFARTIERIQKIVISELTKIAIIHLYAQGYKNKELLDFELSLSNPSVVHEEMKIELGNSKVSLARDMTDTNLLSSDFVYEQIFNLNKKDAEQERLRVIEDKKRMFRYDSIEQDGSDPANQTPNKDKDNDDDNDEFKGENTDEDNDTEDEDNAESSGSRKSKIDTMLGVDDMKDAHKYDKNVINHKYKGGSALSLENIEEEVFAEDDERIEANKALTEKRISDKYGFLERLKMTLNYANKESDKDLLKEVLKEEKDKIMLK